MSRTARHERPPRRGLQRGQGLLGILMIVGVGLSALLFGFITPASLSIKGDKVTAAALAQAKDVLIGRAAADNVRPGSLPCPDIDGDGIAESPVAFGGVCPSYIGLLPWRTLGLDPRDESGERLWYALSPVFRDHASAGLLDNDTKGALTVYYNSTATVLTAEAVAVIFAPGTTLATQNRDASVTALCPTTGTTIARNLCAANYLETAATVNNSTPGGPFITAQSSSTFNDKLLVITTADLMPVVEKRVARTMLALLSAYRAASLCACYPWAANDFDDDSVTSRTRGGVPTDNALPEAWGSGTIPSVPSWIIGSNEWGKRFYYAVAPIETASHSPAATLTADGASKDLVLITTGPAGASRPSSNLIDYIEDLENRNNDNIFQSPSSTAYARNRLYTLP